MIPVPKQTAYKVFGLSVRSEISIPELPEAGPQAEPAEIAIEKADLSRLWFRLANPQDLFVAEHNFFMFRVPDHAIFCVEEGRRIAVSLLEGCDEEIVRLYLLGTCMGALLMQRRVIPLHGSAVAIDGKAYAFIGDRGAGKSTLASAFLHRGYKLVSDDVIAATLNPQHGPWVVPAYPQQKLWEESLRKLGMETSRLRPIYRREAKFAVPVRSQFADASMPLGGVFELVKSDCATVEIQRMAGSARLDPLISHTYRNYLLSPMGLREWHFDTVCRLAGELPIFRLYRPASGFSANHLVSAVLSTLNKEE